MSLMIACLQIHHWHRLVISNHLGSSHVYVTLSGSLFLATEDLNLPDLVAKLMWVRDRNQIQFEEVQFSLFLVKNPFYYIIISSI
jgi:hypothetical protein